MVIQSASLKLQAVLTAVWEKLLPAMQNEPLPESTDYHVLCHRLNKLTLNTMLGVRNPGAEESLHGAVYHAEQPTPSFADLVGGIGKFTQTGGELRSIGFHFTKDIAELVCEQDDASFTVPLGMQGEFVRFAVDGVPYGANARWRAHDTIEVEIRNIRMAGGKRFLLQFGGDKLTLNGDSTMPQAGGLGDPLTPTYTFALADGEVSTRTKMYWEC